MNNKAGKPVFPGNIDEVLSEKIIHHSRSNSTKTGFSDAPASSGGKPARRIFTGWRTVRILIGMAGLLLIAGIVKKYIRQPNRHARHKNR